MSKQVVDTRKGFPEKISAISQDTAMIKLKRPTVTNIVVKM
jgi:hypothetical protein